LNGFSNEIWQPRLEIDKASPMDFTSVTKLASNGDNPDFLTGCAADLREGGFSR
jgi:hypothetical protein